MVCIPSYTPPPLPPDQKAIQATGKLIQEITEAIFVNKIGPYICLISKSAAIYQVTLELLPLYRAAKKKKKPRYGKTVTIYMPNWTSLLNRKASNTCYFPFVLNQKTFYTTAFQVV